LKYKFLLLQALSQSRNSSLKQKPCYTKQCINTVTVPLEHL
jgi:hypothetical protein